MAILPAAQAFADPVTVTSCDRTVAFEAPPERAVSNDINLTEMMLALGLENRMAGYSGVSGWNKMTPEFQEQARTLPQISEKHPTIEVLLSHDTDLYIAGWYYGLRPDGELTPDSLGAFGIDVYELTESCAHVMDRDRVEVEDVFTDLTNLGRIFGVEDRAETVVAAMRAELESIAEATRGGGEPVPVFVYDSGEDAPFTSGRLAMPNAIIEAAGGRNIVDDVEASWTNIGWEPVIERDPHHIIIVDYGAVTADDKIAFLEAHPALSDVTAVRQGRYTVLDYDEATPGVRIMTAIRKLASDLYPELVAADQ